MQMQTRTQKYTPKSKPKLKKMLDMLIWGEGLASVLRAFCVEVSHRLDSLLLVYS